MKLAYHCCVHVASYSFFDSYDAELVGKRNRRPERHTVGKSCVSPSMPGTFKPPCVFRKSYSPGRILRKCLKEESTHMTYYFTIFCIRRGATAIVCPPQRHSTVLINSAIHELVGRPERLPKSLVILLVAKSGSPASTTSSSTLIKSHPGCHLRSLERERNLAKRASSGLAHPVCLSARKK